MGRSRSSGIGIFLTGPLALAGLLFVLSYWAGTNGQADLRDTYLRWAEIVVGLWFLIVIINFAARKRW